MRYLTVLFAAGAIERGRGISQLLGAFDMDGLRGLRLAEVWPASRFEPIRVRLYEVEDLGSGSVTVDEFPGFHPEDEFDPDTPVLAPDRLDEMGGRTVATAATGMDALEVAERLLGAGRERWVNTSVLDDEYADFVRSGSPLGLWHTAP